jgi:hypothetical protein
MNKAVSTIAKMAAAATLLLAGYAIVASLPDLRRYIKISTM